jgi:hypothetical protein
MRGANDTAAIALMGLLACVRVFVYSAAFPFFNNVDEQAHLDLVCKYSHGHVPRTLESYGRESAELITLYQSPEYLTASKDGPESPTPPPKWTLPEAERAAALATAAAGRERRTNHDATQPPVYYVIAGAWYALGQGLGLQGGSLLYWIRFLNVPLIGILVGLSYVAMKRYYPNRRFLHLGVPLLLALFPQDVFYSINNDVPSALVVGAAFYGLLELDATPQRGYGFRALIGSACAIAVLIKFSNVAILAVLAVVLTRETIRQYRASTPWREWLKIATTPVAAALPIAAWVLRSVHFQGDATGSSAKIAFLGWTPMPAARILDHPIFTPAGLAYFWGETVPRFWRGEFVWKLVPLASGWSDRFYSWSSLACLAAGAVVLIATWRDADRDERLVNGTSLLLFVGSMLFLVAVSVSFDYGACWYPSRQRPYLTSGRLLLGALVPFAALYLSGLERILGWARIARFRWAVLGVLAAVMVGSEIAVTRQVFASAYNWFHLP